jgi:hypothetical protein
MTTRTSRETAAWRRPRAIVIGQAAFHNTDSDNTEGTGVRKVPPFSPLVVQTVCKLRRSGDLANAQIEKQRREFEPPPRFRAAS